MTYTEGCSSITRRLFKGVLCTFIFVMLFTDVIAHGTQTAYCVTTGGRVRVWIEHWHGNISAAQTANAAVRIDVVDTSTGASSTVMTIPDGVVWDTPIGSLPDCKGPMNVLSTCPGRANVYNDWVYWDFTPPACFVNLQITIVSVSGTQSFYFDEACTQLYPVTFSDSFIDCVPPTVTCPSNLVVESNMSNCRTQISTGLEPIVLFDDCTPIPQITTTYTITGATIGSGNGNPNGTIFNAGISTITYCVTDNTGKKSTCSFNVAAGDTAPPALTCPFDITLECADPNNNTLINNWLNTVSATDASGIMSLTNNFTSGGFSSIDESINPDFKAISYSNLSMLLPTFLNKDKLLDAIAECNYSAELYITECLGNDHFDEPIGLNVDHEEGMSDNFSDLTISDEEGRLIPYWIETLTKGKQAKVWLKIPHIKSNSKSDFKVSYGSCSNWEFTKEDIFDNIYQGFDLKGDQNEFEIVSDIFTSYNKVERFEKGKINLVKLTADHKYRIK